MEHFQGRSNGDKARCSTRQPPCCRVPKPAAVRKSEQEAFVEEASDVREDLRYRLARYSCPDALSMEAK